MRIVFYILTSLMALGEVRILALLTRFIKISFLVLMILLSNLILAQSNYSVRFDGIDDYVGFPPIPVKGDSNLTYEIKVSLSSFITPTGSISTAIINRNNFFDGNPSLFNINVIDDKFAFRVRDTLKQNQTDILSLDTIEVNQWYHVSIVREYQNYFKLYVDGIIQDSLVDNGMAISLQPPLLAKTPGSGFEPSHMEGNISEFRIWNVALDSIQIQQYMECPPSINETGLVGYWTFDEGTGITTKDQTENGNDAALKNGVEWSDNVPQTNCITGISSISNLNTKVYPNPTKSTITINNKEIREEINWQLIDKIGKVVLQGSIMPYKSQTINLSSIKSGIYILQMFGAKYEKTRLIIKY